MKGRKGWLGYTPASVERYISVLETERLLLEERNETKRQEYEAALLPSRRAVERSRQELRQLEQLEARLTEWVSRNESL
ncbi:hypothetical protein [Paenibacillus sp. HJGM_3]|uniref:hypothetical protein n=1 Tax=Paenibacillus sp. HJGM_3 TaxID=3379816 RepID=UPI00385CFDB5